MKDSSKKLIKDPDVMAIIRSAVNYTLSELTLRDTPWTNAEFEDLVVQNVVSLAETGEPVRGTLGSDESKEIDDLVAGSTLAAIPVPVPESGEPMKEPDQWDANPDTNGAGGSLDTVVGESGNGPQDQ